MWEIRVIGNFGFYFFISSQRSVEESFSNFMIFCCTFLHVSCFIYTFFAVPQVFQFVVLFSCILIFNQIDNDTQCLRVPASSAYFMLTVFFMIIFNCFDIFTVFGFFFFQFASVLPFFITFHPILQLLLSYQNIYNFLLEYFSVFGNLIFIGWFVCSSIWWYHI